ncbi:M24 family metallopeptidase [Halomicroarcula sp. GCM10025817]|uniref:M24 family metallopeptidase n=1 Tax=Haloarcula TaxID=2237 RepID=UPI0023E81F6F|nr:Xaa-Pro peptidase family protein [Halomicroarcula sp. SYNS111]
MAQQPTLPTSEYERRVSAVRESMAAKGYDLFVVYSDEYRLGDGFYLSNFKPINVLEEAHQLVLIPIDDDPVLLTGTLNSYGAKERSWIDDVRYFETLTETLEDVVSRSEGVSKVGLAGEKLLPVRYYNQIDDALSGQELVHDDDLLARLRQYKSDAEIRMLEQSAHVGDQSIVDVVDAMEVGDSEADLAAVGEYSARRQSAEIGSAYVIFAGDNTRHPTWRPSPDHYVEAGDYVIIDASPQYRGYAADVAITAIAGEDEQKAETYARANQLTNDFIEEDMYPGVSASGLYERMLERAEEAGWRDEFEPWAQGVRAIGHGVGVDVVEWPNLGPNTDVELEPGMVVAIKFDLHGIPGGGLRVERMVHIQEDDVRCLNFTDPDAIPAHTRQYL